MSSLGCKEMAWGNGVDDEGSGHLYKLLGRRPCTHTLMEPEPQRAELLAGTAIILPRKEEVSSLIHVLPILHAARGGMRRLYEPDSYMRGEGQPYHSVTIFLRRGVPCLFMSHLSSGTIRIEFLSFLSTIGKTTALKFAKESAQSTNTNHIELSRESPPKTAGATLPVSSLPTTHGSRKPCFTGIV